MIVEPRMIKKLFFQHNPNWILHGEHKGKIAIYDNGLARPGVDYYDSYSTAPIIETPLQSDGTYLIEDNMAYGPIDATETYGLPGSEVQFYSSYTSGHKVLQNGNSLVTVGVSSKALEITPDGKLVWDYDLSSFSYIFRAVKYAADYPAFEGRDLTPTGTVENPPSPAAAACMSDSIDTKTNSISEDLLKAWVDSESRQLYIQTDMINDLEITLYDMLGTKWQQLNAFDSWHTASAHTMSHALPATINGAFILNIRNKKEGNQRSIKLFLSN